MKQIKKDLQQLNKADLYRVLWYARFKFLVYRIRTLTPVQIVFPAITMQIIALMLFAHAPLIFGVSVLAIVGIALLPMTMKKPRPQYHWVREYYAIHKDRSH